MPLEEANVIDAIAKAKDGRVALCIVDAGITTDPAQRFDLLMQKMRAYVNGIMSGALASDYPNHRPKDFIIRVACSLRPTPQMEQIAQIMPRGDPSNAVQVVYEEFPSGAWSAAESAASQAAMPGQTEAEASTEEPPMADATNWGVFKAELFLAAGRKGFCFAIVGSSAGKDVVTFCEDSFSDEIMEQAQQYARNLPPEFTFCVLIADVDEAPVEGKSQTVIMAIACDRAEEKALVFAKAFKRKTVFSGYKALEPLKYIGAVRNYMRDG